MSQKKRTQVIKEFQSSDAHSPTIMLLSLKAGGVGLNLTAASHVFLMDPVRAESEQLDFVLTFCEPRGLKRQISSKTKPFYYKKIQKVQQK